MISIGDVCPLFFDVLTYQYASKGQFRQFFHSSDGIRIQIFCDEGETPLVYLNDKINGSSEKVSLFSYRITDDIVMYHAHLTPSEGVYTISIQGKESEEFEICEQPDGILIEYSHKDNNSVFDNIFWLGDIQQKFRFRIRGGFKPSGVTLEVDNEQFTNQRQEIVELYSIPYTTQTLTIGDNLGVPYYVAEFLNKIFCLSDVKIDGKSYVREGNSKPEKADTIGNKELFIWTLSLRPSVNDIAGIGGKQEEGTAASMVGFAINNAQDGEVLVYDSSESAFVNTNQLNS